MHLNIRDAYITSTKRTFCFVKVSKNLIILKEDFAELLKNLARYRSENNFFGALKQLYITNSNMMNNATKNLIF